MKFIEILKFQELKEVRFLGISILKIIVKKSKNEIIKKYQIFSKSFERQFLDTIVQNIPPEHDLIYFIRPGRLGEAHLLNFMIDEINEKYNAKNPCIVSNDKFHENLYEIYLDIPFYHVNMDWKYVNIAITKKNYKYKGRKIKIFHSTYQESMDIHNNKFAQNVGKDYPTEIRELTGVTKFKNKQQKFSNDTIESLESKTINLNKNKFVLLMPEAHSMKSLTSKFWYELKNKLEEAGYDIFVNTITGTSTLGHSAILNIAEVTYLATLAKSVISLRSGLTEVISSHKTPKHVIYTPHKCNPVSASEMMRNSSLNHYPMVDKNTVFEYNTDELSETQIIDEIMKGF